ncbi:NAD-dependent malic oxidoreductase [Chloropicon primus]|uniref:NAD-dependent malic oxidoreductase n=1 Tax=Chloropicon primus TaxID=1764295 RepID=A0A5B8MS54_9CHLO|nr:NAD-dependent malic oxidoreductase [Chloropicon primus]|eukprot:QDZ23548.1 NAD-dependent malic oxidoreductase [Chloropicon primus]
MQRKTSSSLLGLVGRGGVYGRSCPHRSLVATTGSSEEVEPPPYNPDVKDRSVIVRKKGVEVLHDPWWNKGTSFNYVERDALSLRGLLPPCEIPFSKQIERFMKEYQHGIAHVAPKDETVTPENIRKWKALESLQNRNEVLFYKILLDNFEDMAPIVYTPTVGWCCQNFHLIYRQARGLFISERDRGMMSSLVYNWPASKIHAIVVTDGSRVLGLGDLGVNGLGISIGKLDIYCAGAGFHPSRVMPVVIDVGTNNESLLNHPLYFGLRRRRLEGDEYYELIDEFMRAVLARYPNVLIQFEDFSTNHAQALLDRYREHHLVFNDDIQGTATTVLGGIYGALAVKGSQAKDITEQTIVVCGAGSAGMGVVQFLAKAMTKHGLSEEEARERFWILDEDGLITRGRPGNVPSFVKPFSRKDAGMEGQDLLSTIREAKPTILIGASTVGGLFTSEHLEAMSESCDRPLVMPLSNPTSKLECTSEQSAQWTKGKGIFAAGSPQPNCVYDGQEIASSQANNMYIFPGLALGASVGKCKIITDNMLMSASESLVNCITQEDLSKGSIYPKLSMIRDISLEIACSVIEQAVVDKVVKADSRAAEVLEEQGREGLKSFVKSRMFQPNYDPLVYLPPGIGE